MLTSSRSISLLPPTLQHQQQQLWIRSLDSVLHNHTAFDAFHKWLSSNRAEQHSRHHPLDALECYLAILAYHKCVAAQDPKSKQMALALHRRFISPKSGTCWFVPMEVRQAVSQSLHSCSGEELENDVFDECVPHIWDHLTQQHALFVCSSHFSQLSSQLMHDVPTSSTFHYIPRLSNLQELSSARHAHTNTSMCTPTQTTTSSNSSRLYRLGARRRCTERLPSQTPSFPTQRLLYPISTRARTSSEPPPVLCEGGPECLLPTQPTTSTEVVSQTRRFQRQQMVLGHNIQLNHQRPEDRQEFAQSLECLLNQLIEKVRLMEEQTGETIFPRNLHSNNNRQLCAWDEEDTLPPELLCEWMRNSGVQHQQQPDTTRPDLFLPSSSKTEEQPIYSHASIQQYLGPKYYECDHSINEPVSHQHHQFLSQPTLRATSSSYGHYSDSSGFCSSDSAYHLQYGQKETVEQDRRTASNNRQKVDGPTTSNNTNLMIMSYRETNGVPFVAKLSEKDMFNVTFKEFRRQFGISSKTNKRFLFKSLCEDDSAPFQWTVANEDDMLLPVFEGRITAECRSISESY